MDRQIPSQFLGRLILVLSFLFLSSCAYRFSNLDRELPGGYSVVSVPIFKNLTYEPGIETEFTNALVLELTRSKKISVTAKKSAPVVIEGRIESIQYVPFYQQTSSEVPTLPEGTALNSEYRILITVSLQMTRISDRKKIWSGRFQSSRTYSRSRITPLPLKSSRPYFFAI